MVRNMIRFYGEVLLAHHPNYQAGGPPLVGCPRLLIQHICSYPPYWRPFLHPQPEDAPCCGDRDPLVMYDDAADADAADDDDINNNNNNNNRNEYQEYFLGVKAAGA